MARTKEERHEYYLNNKSKSNEKSKRWRLEHPERSRELCKNWAKNHPEQVRKLRRTHKRKIRLEIINLLGNKCNNPNCAVIGGMTDVRALQIDHINGGGRKQMLSFTTQHQYYDYILKEIKGGSKDYQLLCANCNWIKRFEKGEGFIK